MKLRLSLGVLLFVALVINGTNTESTTSAEIPTTESVETSSAEVTEAITETQKPAEEKDTESGEVTEKENQPDDTSEATDPNFSERKYTGNKLFKTKADEEAVRIHFNQLPPTNLSLGDDPNHHVFHENHNFLEKDEDMNINNEQKKVTAANNKDVPIARDKNKKTTEINANNNNNNGSDNQDLSSQRIDEGVISGIDGNQNSNESVDDLDSKQTGNSEVKGKTYEPSVPQLSAPEFIQMYEGDVMPVCRDNQYSIHSYNSDVYDAIKANLKASASATYDTVRGRFWRALTSQQHLDRSDPVIARQLDLINSQVGSGTLQFAQNQAVQVAKLYLEESYRERFVPNFYNRQQLTFIQKIENILRHPNTSYDEKLYYWKEWHKRTDNATMHMNQIVNQYIAMAAKTQSLKNGAELLRKPYENIHLEKDINRLWNAVQPLYSLLKKYVQRIMKNKYKDMYQYRGWLLPAHLAGSTTGGDWTHLYEEAKPYPCESASSRQSITNYIEYCDASQIFRNNIGMTNMTIVCSSLFDVRTSNYSASECRPKSYDFCDGISYAMYVCENRPLDFDFGREFENMFYSMEYSNMPFILRNPHPVIRDAITSLMTTQVFRFGAENRYNEEAAINQLMYEALYFLPKIAYAMSITEFQWQTATRQYVWGGWNKLWWDLKYRFEGVEPPENYEKGSYDPAANYDISMGNDKTSDILSPFVFYQMLRALCDSTHVRFSKHSVVQCSKGPSRNIFTKRYLYQCNLLGRMDVGKWLQYVQSQGRALDWRTILLQTTGTSEIKPDDLLEYFSPLHDYLYYQDPEYQGLWTLLWIVIALFILIIIIILIICFMRRKRRQSATLNHKLENRNMEQPSTSMTRSSGHNNDGFQSVDIESSKH